MTIKSCFKCNELKDISEFYKHNGMADGHLNKCKECTKKYVTSHRNENIEYCREYDRKRANSPSRLESKQRYRSSERGKYVVLKSHKRYREKFPSKRKAHIIVGNFLRDGKIIRPDRCEKCRVECKPQAHHCDYTKPLEVMWLCQSCHVEWHKNNTPIYETKAA